MMVLLLIIEDFECAICQDNSPEDVKVLVCDHAYHRRCINKWLREKDNCPMCRATREISPASSLPNDETGLIDRDHENLIRMLDGLTV